MTAVVACISGQHFYNYNPQTEHVILLRYNTITSVYDIVESIKATVSELVRKTNTILDHYQNTNWFTKWCIYLLCSFENLSFMGFC